MNRLVICAALGACPAVCAADVTRIYATSGVSVRLDLTRPPQDPLYFTPVLPTGQSVATAGQYPWNITRTLLRFDLSALPEDAQVRGAILHMNVSASLPTEEPEWQLVQRLDFDMWDDNAVPVSGYVSATPTLLGAAVRLLAANNTVTWSLNLQAWDIAQDLADDALTLEVRYLTEGDYSYRGTSYYSHLAQPGDSLRPYVELDIAACDSIDFNKDTLFPDTADIDDFLSVFSGGPCSTGLCGDIDFNNDGLFPDTLDIDSLLSVFSGGPCL